MIPEQPTGRTDGGHYPRAWLAWALAAAASFVAIEVAALRSDPGPKTLSAQLRRRRRVSAAAIGAFAAWAIHHIVWQGNR